MLSHNTNQTSNMDPRTQQAYHTRQQSNPTFEVVNMAHFPASAPNPSDPAHRRGMSLNQGMPRLQQRYPAQGRRAMVSITNPGHPPQHYLQEAQQHSQALPGLPEQQMRVIEEMQRRKEQESLLEMNSYMRQNHAVHSFGPSKQTPMERSRSIPYNGANYDAAMASQALAGAQATLTIRGSSAHSHYRTRDPMMGPESNVVFPASSSQRPNWQQHAQQRPVTPENSSMFSEALMTPETSPRAGSKAQQSEDMDTSSTIRAVRRPGRDVQMSRQMFERATSSEEMDMSETMPAGRASLLAALPPTDAYLAPSNQQSQFPSPPNTVPLPQGRYFDALARGVPADFAVAQGSSLPADTFRHGRHGSGSWTAASDFDHLQLLAMPHGRESCEFESESSPGFQQSPSTQLEYLDLDATHEETGISADEVQRYISEADPDDGKWSCLFPECDKRFGRKENVRAHVQTHLGDRQYKCPVCTKCFVRQHDLKRHLKTHSGAKPYPCACGRDFARHDALTRHRQRNNCCGGIDGFIKKASKRGRPRKQRPDDVERANKAALTRMRTGPLDYPSSASGHSDDGSPGHSPQSQSSELDMILAKFDEEEAQRLRSARAQSSPSPRGVYPPQEAQEAMWNNAYQQEHKHAHGSPASTHFDSIGDSPPPLSHSSPRRCSRNHGEAANSWFNSSQSYRGDEEQVSPAFLASSINSSMNNDFASNDFFGATLDVEGPWKATDNDFNLDSFIKYDEEEPNNMHDNKFNHSFNDGAMLSGALESMEHAYHE